MYVPSIFECFHDQQDPRWYGKHYEFTEPESSKTAKILFFFFLSSDVLLNIAWTSHSGLRIKQQHFIWSSAQPHFQNLARHS